MIELNVMFFFQMANFLITLIFLNYLLIRPIRRIISARENNLAQMLSETEKFSSQAEEKLASYEAAISDARDAALKRRAELKAEGLAQETKLMEDAAGEAHKILTAAREEIAGETRKAVADFKLRIDDLARQATARVLS